jgi:hypothetical protein
MAGNPPRGDQVLAAAQLQVGAVSIRACIAFFVRLLTQHGLDVVAQLRRHSGYDTGAGVPDHQIPFLVECREIRRAILCHGT